MPKPGGARTVLKPEDRRRDAPRGTRRAQAASLHLHPLQAKVSHALAICLTLWAL